MDVKALKGTLTLRVLYFAATLLKTQKMGKTKGHATEHPTISTIPMTL
jgi:hypothetical protein